MEPGSLHASRAPKRLSGLALGFHGIEAEVTDETGAERPQLSPRTRAAPPFENDTPRCDNMRSCARRQAMPSRLRVGGSREGRGARAQRDSGQGGDICLGEHPGVSRSGLHGRTMFAPLRRVNQPEVGGGDAALVLVRKYPGAAQCRVGKIAWHIDHKSRRRHAILPTRVAARPERVGNAPLRGALIFNAAVRARRPPYTRPLTLRRA
jgi:hypothetical protein